ncbi:MAG: MoaD family protein [Candidatus Thorarchaeota archaeon]|nr:MoaD family protein [Candidatus Thorarchaeota archaeon]
MKVKVQYFGFIQGMLGKKGEEFELREGSCLSDLLNKMARIYGEQFQREVYEPGEKDVKSGFTVTVNGLLFGQLRGVDTGLSAGDKITFMTVASGG